MELRTRIMPKIGYNSNYVWNLVVENNCRKFAELRGVLHILSNINKGLFLHNIKGAKT